MTLRVLNVPNPAVGTDWRFTIPNQWVLDVVAIKATLTTPPNISSAVDSGPNALPLAITQNIPGIQWGAPGPFASSPNRGVYHDVSINPSGSFGLSPASALFSPATFTFDGWFKLDPSNSWTQTGAFFDLSLGVGSERIEVFVNFPPATPQDLFDLNGNTLIRHNTLTIPRGVWNHHAWTWDGVTLRQYLNGVLAITWGADVVAPGATDRVAVAANRAGGATFPGSFAACAFYGAALTAPQLLVHAGASSSSAAYKAAVLADTPVALWMLDDVGNGGTRAAGLRVTDGTTNLAQYPGGTIAGVGNALSWCWQSQAPGTTQSADGLTTLVQIPDLVLPGGYTLGTITPDLLGTDQWSGINIWWNDTSSSGIPDALALDGRYLNRFLVPDYSHRSL